MRVERSRRLERDQLVNELSSGAMTRAQVLRAVAENAEFTRAHFNRAFVLMKYFGYLRRNPNDFPDYNFGGYNFWLTKLDQFNGTFVQAEMVEAFITSIEYRAMYAPAFSLGFFVAIDNKRLVDLSPKRKVAARGWPLKIRPSACDGIVTGIQIRTRAGDIAA
jgi:hypothetical protein